VNMAAGAGQSVGLNWINVRTPGSDPARIVAASYSFSLRNGVYFSASAFQDLKDRSQRGLFATLSVAFGNRLSSSVGAGKQNGDSSFNASLSRAPDFGGGVGWALQAGGVGETRYNQAQVQYLGNAGQITAMTQANRTNRSTAIDLSGALVLMDGSLQAARQVGAGFALVSTEGVAGVPVFHENREIGRTGRTGHLLVPNLVPYAQNQISIDTSELPADTRIATSRTSVVPRQLAGVLARFPVQRYAAATIYLQQPDGKPIAVGTVVRHVGSGAETVVGYDGVAFIDGLDDDNTLHVGSGETRCVVQFAYTASGNGSLPVIGPLPCRPLPGDAP